MFILHSVMIATVVANQIMANNPDAVNVEPEPPGKWDKWIWAVIILIDLLPLVLMTLALVGMFVIGCALVGESLHPGNLKLLVEVMK